MDESLTPETLKMLRRAGWTEARQADPAWTVEALEDRGYYVAPCVVEFLARFGDLAVPEPNTSHPSCRTILATYPLMAAERILPRWLERWQQRVNARLCPIGIAAFDSLILLMDEHGRSFSVTEAGELLCVADNTCDLLYSVLVGGYQEPVTEEDRWPH